MSLLRSSLQKKTKQKRQSAPGWPPPPPKAGEKIRTTQGGGTFFSQTVFRGKPFCLRKKKKKKKRRRNVVCEPQTSSSFKKNEREKERTSQKRGGLISPLIQKRFKIFRLLARAKTQGHESSNNDIGHVFHENGSIFFVFLLPVEMQNFLLLVDVDVDVFHCAEKKPPQVAGGVV